MYDEILSSILNKQLPESGIKPERGNSKIYIDTELKWVFPKERAAAGVSSHFLIYLRKQKNQ